MFAAREVNPCGCDLSSQHRAACTRRVSIEAWLHRPDFSPRAPPIEARRAGGRLQRSQEAVKAEAAADAKKRGDDKLI
jgi:hypothetical protein